VEKERFIQKIKRFYLREKGLARKKIEIVLIG